MSRAKKASRKHVAPKDRPIKQVDVRSLCTYVRESKVVADAMRGELVELLSALQGNRDSDELILNALAALAGSLEELHANTGAAVRELEKTLEYVSSYSYGKVRITVWSFLGQPAPLVESEASP